MKINDESNTYFLALLNSRTSNNRSPRFYFYFFPRIIMESHYLSMQLIKNLCVGKMHKENSRLPYYFVFFTASLDLLHFYFYFNLFFPFFSPVCFINKRAAGTKYLSNRSSSKIKRLQKCRVFLIVTRLFFYRFRKGASSRLQSGLFLFLK